MAERRMFSKAITRAARFLRLSPSARLLYYDLGMEADDDGVVEAFPVLRMTDAKEEDLNALASKGLVQILNDDLVTFICDWRLNNQIRQDRYRPSIHADLLATIGIPNGNQMATVGKPSVGKDSVGKDSIGECTPPQLDEVISFCKERDSNIDPVRFHSYYSAHGWDGVKDWKSMILSWETNGIDRPKLKLLPEDDLSDII